MPVYSVLMERVQISQALMTVCAHNKRDARKIALRLVPTLRAWGSPMIVWKALGCYLKKSSRPAAARCPAARRTK